MTNKKFQIIRNRRAISEIIAYVFLIVIAVSLSLGVYTWLKNYILKPEKACPDDISLIVADYSCTNNQASLNLKNKGNFDIEAVIVKYSNDSGKIPTINVGDSEGIYFFNGKNPLRANENYSIEFDYSGKIYSIETFPIKIIDRQPVICTNSRQKLALENCPQEFAT